MKRRSRFAATSAHRMYWQHSSWLGQMLGEHQQDEEDEEEEEEAWGVKGEWEEGR